MNLDAIPHRFVTAREAAQFLNCAPATLVKVAADQQRKPQERRFSMRTHRRFPAMKKQGRDWAVWGPRLRQFIEERA